MAADSIRSARRGAAGAWLHVHRPGAAGAWLHVLRPLPTRRFRASSRCHSLANFAVPERATEALPAAMGPGGTITFMPEMASFYVPRRSPAQTKRVTR